MSEVTLSEAGSAASLYVWELIVQTAMAKLVYDRLEEYARVQVERDFGATSPRPQTVIEVFADCSVFLSASGVISKLLLADAGKSPGQIAKVPKLRVAVKRSMALRDLLGVTALPALNGLATRNSFEHIDDRLDRQLESGPSGTFRYLQASIAPSRSPKVLKAFDPTTLTLSYLADTLDLRACWTELLDVQQRAEAARSRARTFQPLIDAAR